MNFYNSSDRETKELLPGINARTFWGDRVMLAVVDLDANSMLPTHSHPHEQAGYVLEGELEMNIAGNLRLIRPGDIYFIPGNIEHSVTVGSQGAKILDIFSPIREEYK